MKEITVQTLKERRDSDADLFLLDVRDSFEYQIANIGGTLIPLAELEARLDELPEDRTSTIVVMCRSGKRSAEAAQRLEREGFTRVENLKGGILAWAREIDPTLPEY